MKLPRQKKKELSSAAIVQTFVAIFVSFVLLALTAVAADPSWWSARGATHAPQVVTNSGVVTTNYVPNNYGAATQGQLKHFTASAIAEMNANLPGGAGSDLNSIKSNWASDYTTNGYGASNIKKSDFNVINEGQLKYIGNKVWSRLVAAGYTNAVPSWLAQNTNSDYSAVDINEMKMVFAFNITAMFTAAPTFSPPAGSYSSSQTVTISSATPSATIYYTTDGSTPTTSSTSGTSVTVSSTKTIKAIAAASGHSNSTVSVASYTIAPSGSPVITSGSTASGTVGAAFTYNTTASNSPTSFGESGLPGELSINPTTGAITGTPTTAGTYSVSLTATNATGTGTLTLTLTINPPAPVIITSSLTATCTLGVPYSYSIVASNSPTSYSASGLPSWLSVNTVTGVITGTPTATGLFTMTIGASNATGSDSKTLSLTSAPVVAAANGMTNLVFSDDFTSSSTFTTNMDSSPVSGKKWYVEQFGWQNPSNVSINTGAGTGALAGATGILTVTADSGVWTVPTYYNYVTDPVNGVLGPVAIGTDFLGTWTFFYSEVRAQFLGTGQNTGVYNSNPTLNQYGWPSIWFYGISNFDGVSTNSTLETDNIEAYQTVKDAAINPINTSHAWLHTSPKATQTASTDGSNDMEHLDSPSGTVPNPGDGAWHIWGEAIIPNNPPTTAYVYYYYDNHLIYHHGGAYRLLIGAGTPYPLDHLPLILSSGPDWPLNVDWVHIYQ